MAGSRRNAQVATEARAIAAVTAAADLPPGSETQVVLFSGETAAQFDARRLNPTAPLADQFRDRAARFATQLAKRSLVAYNHGRTPSGYEAAYVSVDAVPGLTDVLAQAEAPIELELFRPTSNAADALKFYVVSVRKQNSGWVHFLHAKGATLRIKRTLKIAAVLRGAAYDELAADALIFDPNFDAVITQNIALVVNQGAFERSLGFVDQARQLARATLAQLATTLELSNLGDFVEAATSDMNMVAKLRSIAEKMATNPAYAAAMTTERLIEFAEANEIEIDTEDVDGHRSFVFLSDPQHRWRLLKLLDDDYLHSQLTETDYEVNSKSPLDRQ